MLADIQKLTDILAIDADGRFSQEDRAAAIDLALFRYSSDRPRTACETVVFDGSAFLSMPDGWQKDFSRVLDIKTDSGRVPFETVPSLSGEKILLSGDVRMGDVLTVWFTQRHVATETEDTVPPADREAVANWAAAFLLDGMAAGYAGSVNSTISSDSVEHGSKANNYHAQAAACRKFYRDHMGLDDKRNAAAGTTVVVKRSGTSGRMSIVNRRRNDD